MRIKSSKTISSEVRSCVGCKLWSGSTCIKVGCF